MIPDAQLLTDPKTLATCDPDLSLTAKSLISSSFIFLQVSPDLKEEEHMAAPQGRPHSSSSADNELWFNMPSSRRHQEQSAYQATTNRYHATRSSSANHPQVPLISTSVELNKPLPPSPEAQKKKNKPGLLNLIKKTSSGNLDSSHLQPEPLRVHKRSTSNGKLSPEPHSDHFQSRSMPSSPLQYSPRHPPDIQRAHSTVGHYADVPEYQPYTSPPRPQISEQQRAVSMATHFDSSPPRPRRGSSFPDPNTVTPRESISDVPRPHTWVSPTETFGDATDFHLFAEATAGLPGGFDPLSPTETPRLQGSLFARGNRNDIIPLLARDTLPRDTPARSAPVAEVPQYEWIPTQAPRDIPLSSSALPRTSSSALPRHDSYDIDESPSPRMPNNLNAVNLELERLGLSDNERPPDDELPDYQQSQAEMAALKRKEASDRARELESRWNLSRGWRNR